MGKIRHQIIDNKVYNFHTVVVHEFSMGDVEDPDLYAAEPLYKWEKSEAGEFVMGNATEPPIWHRQADSYNYGYKYIILAELEEKKLSEFYLRFDKSKV